MIDLYKHDQAGWWDRWGDVTTILGVGLFFFVVMILAIIVFKVPNRPCGYYANTALKDVPARCVQGFKAEGK